jgi:hypothetical protein
MVDIDIEIGDYVKITIPGYMYKIYDKWLEKNNLSKENWNMKFNIRHTYKVIFKGPHLDRSREKTELFYIESIDNGCRIIIGKKGIELIEKMTNDNSKSYHRIIEDIFQDFKV